MCGHENLTVIAKGTRVKEKGELVHFIADVKIVCDDCGEPFGFRGVPGGFNWDGPTESLGHELHLPLMSPAELALADIHPHAFTD